MLHSEVESKDDKLDGFAGNEISQDIVSPSGRGSEKESADLLP